MSGVLQAVIWYVREAIIRRIAEIHSPTSSFRRAKRHDFNSGQILDLELGDDLLSEPVRQSVLTYLQHERPGLVIIYSFRARPDQLFNLSRSFLEKDHGHMKKHIDHRKKGRRLLEFAVQVGQLCSKLGLKFAVDCPWPQRSWQTRGLHPLLAPSGAECVLKNAVVVQEDHFPIVPNPILLGSLQAL